MPNAWKEKRFRELTPEKFLRGDPSNTKATFDQLVEAFGNVFLMRTADLDIFYKHRNLIARHYFNLFKIRIEVVDQPEDGLAFLRDFLRPDVQRLV